MKEGYYSFSHGGSFEIFYIDFIDAGIGYYWWPCFPGCLPDGDANGPFESVEEAFENAMET